MRTHNEYLLYQHELDEDLLGSLTSRVDSDCKLNVETFFDRTKEEKEDEYNREEFNQLFRCF